MCYNFLTCLQMRLIVRCAVLSLSKGGRSSKHRIAAVSHVEIAPGISWAREDPFHRPIIQASKVRRSTFPKCSAPAPCYAARRS
jgi:hypothetical protein